MRHLRPLLVMAGIKDMGAAKVVGPTVHELRTRGHQVHLFADCEGKGKTTLASLALSPVETTGGDVHALPRPDLIIVGVSHPRGSLEEELEAVAVTHRIPLALIEDYWGTVRMRGSAEPNLVVTIDSFAESLVNERFPNAQTVSAGFHGFTAHAVTPELAALADSIHANGWKLLCFTGAGESCAPALELLVASLLLTKTPYVLVPNFHPKYIGVPMPGGTETWDAHWNRILTPLRMRGKVIVSSSPGDQIASVADVTFTDHGSLAFTTAAAGKTPVTLDTPEGRAYYKKIAGIDQIPLMRYPGVPVVDQAVPLDSVLLQAAPTLALAAFNPAIAADRIEQLFP